MVSDTGCGIPWPGRMREDSNAAEAWNDFHEEFNLYIGVAQLKNRNATEQAQLMLLCIGNVGRRVAKSFTDEEKSNINDLTAKFEEAFKPRKNVIFERCKFLSCKQKTDQSYENFFQELKTLAKSCEYNERTDEFIRDKIVFSIRDDKMRKSLMKNSQLTLNEAIDACKCDELADAQVEEMKNACNVPDTELNVDNVNSTRKQSTQKDDQWCRYGRRMDRQGRQFCRNKNIICFRCKHKGHIERYCYQNQRQIKEDSDHEDKFICGLVSRNEDYHSGWKLKRNFDDKTRKRTCGCTKMKKRKNESAKAYGRSSEIQMNSITKSKLQVKHYKECKFCDTKHLWGAERCPAFGKTCANCKMKNHSTQACRNLSYSKMAKARSREMAELRVNEINEASEIVEDNGEAVRQTKEETADKDISESDGETESKLDTADEMVKMKSPVDADERLQKYSEKRLGPEGYIEYMFENSPANRKKRKARRKTKGKQRGGM